MPEVIREQNEQNNNEQIKEFIKNLKIKTVAVGGYSKEDVHECIEQLCAMYESKIAALQAQSKQKLQAPAKTLSVSANKSNAEANESIRALIRENEMLKEKLGENKDGKDMIAEVMMDARRNSDLIIREAEEKAASILEEVDNETERRIQYRNEVIESLRAENDKYVEYIESLGGGISQIAENLERLKGKMKNMSEEIFNPSCGEEENAEEDVESDAESDADGQEKSEDE